MASDDKVFSDDGFMDKFVNFFAFMVDAPITWVRENVVVPNRKEYYWYHKKYRRVPTVDECYVDDEVCIYEAQEQFLRDRKVENFIVRILKRRYEYCEANNVHDKEDCAPLKEVYNKAAVNYFIKYGELGLYKNAIACLMKQKNRMAWERRNGPIGSGRKSVVQEEDFQVKEKKSCK